MSKLKRYRENILQFVLEEFQATPDKWQELGLLAFASDDPKTFRISLQACAGPGKSTLLCWCGWWFLLVMGDVGEHPKAAAVSITSDNLKDNLWSEMSKWQSRSTLLMQAFEWTQTRIYAKDHPNTWFMAARGFAQTADTEAIGRTLSGLHSKYVLYLIDESGDIPPSIIKSAEQGLSTKPIFGKILQAGNPTSHDGMLYAAATVLRDQWHIIRITGDPDDVNRSPRIDIEWARAQIKQYGRDNPWVKAFILGEFPDSAINTLLSLSEIEAAINRQIHETTYNWAQKRLGVDVARFGCFDNKTEILTNYGWKYFEDLSGSEFVLSTEPNSNESKWMPITQLHKYEFDGKLNVVENVSSNFAITDNHNLIIRNNPKSDQYKIEQLKNIKADVFVLRNNFGWSGTSDQFMYFDRYRQMPNGGFNRYPIKFDMIDWAYFLGWFVSEGNVYLEKRHKGRYRILIAQRTRHKIQMIKDLLERMNIKYRMVSNYSQIEFCSKEIGQHLREFCGIGAENKKIPTYIKEGSSEIIEAFLLTYRLGDGTCKKNGDGISYSTTSVQLANDLQEVLAKIGKAGKMGIKQRKGSSFLIEGRIAVRSHDVYVIYQKKNSSDIWLHKKQIRKEKYTGYVYCVSTPFKTICVRRGGCVMWSGNSDDSCIFPRQGLRAFKPLVLKGLRSNEVAARVAHSKNKWNSAMEFIDDTGGYGSGVIDALLQAGHSPTAVNFSSKSPDPKYFNMRSYIWFMMAEWIKRGGSLPNDARLIKELAAPQYSFHNGKFRLEEKDQIKKRLGFSPDLADSLCLSFSMPEYARTDDMKLAQVGSAHSTSKVEYDPMDFNKESSN